MNMLLLLYYGGSRNYLNQWENFQHKYKNGKGCHDDDGKSQRHFVVDRTENVCMYECRGE